jgi:hypothetical protein
MDMKKFLQAVDGAEKSTVADSSDMKKFLSVVSEAEINQSDPNYVEYAQLMAKYDMLAKEAGIDGNNNIVDVNAGASPDAIAEIGKIKSRAGQLAGPNLQAWEQARQKENSTSMVQANSNLPAMAAQLENVGMNKLLSIVTESKGSNNKLTNAENMVYMNTPKLKPVKIDEAPSLLKAYLTLVEDEHINQETNLKKSLADHLEEVKQELVPSSKPRNFVAKNATTSGAGAHKDKKKAEKQGDTKHKAKAIPMDEQGVAGPKDCWPGHKKVGTQPGTGKNAGKRVNDCEKIKKEAIDEGDEQ